jgi:hypothetical protein
MTAEKQRACEELGVILGRLLDEAMVPGWTGRLAVEIDIVYGTILSKVSRVEKRE